MVSPYFPSQELVTGLMAETVVDDFEAIEVEEENSKATVVPSCTAQGAFEAIQKESPIRQARQWVVHLAIGDVGL